MRASGRIAVFVFWILVAAAALGPRMRGQDGETGLVKSVQDAGAGPLTGVTQSAIYQWMTYHRDVATPTAAQCASIIPTAPASWFDSLEGSVCFAATAAMASAPREGR